MGNFKRLLGCLVVLAIVLVSVGSGTARKRPQGVPETIHHTDRRAAWEAALRVVKDRGLSVYEWDEEQGTIETGWKMSAHGDMFERMYKFDIRVTDDRVDVDSTVKFCAPIGGDCKIMDNLNDEERKQEKAIIARLRHELSQTTGRSPPEE